MHGDPGSNLCSPPTERMLHRLWRCVQAFLLLSITVSPSSSLFIKQIYIWRAGGQAKKMATRGSGVVHAIALGAKQWLCRRQLPSRICYLSWVNLWVQTPTLYRTTMDRRWNNLAKPTPQNSKISQPINYINFLFTSSENSRKIRNLRIHFISSTIYVYFLTQHWVQEVWKSFM